MPSIKVGDRTQESRVHRLLNSLMTLGKSFHTSMDVGISIYKMVWIGDDNRADENEPYLDFPTNGALDSSDEK